MKNYQAITLILALALLITSYTVFDLRKELAEAPQSLESPQEAVLANIFSRKSVRKYTDQLVSQDDLITIMKAGMAAPTAMDKRPWQFVAITDRGIMMDLRKELKWATGLDGSPAAIVVCGDLSKMDGAPEDFWITDTCAATQNILLAIESMGLGGVWCSLYPGADRMEHARQVLNLPDHLMPMSIIPLGYPTGVEQPKEKFDASNIHWNQW